MLEWGINIYYFSRMRAVIQRVSEASVAVDGSVTGSIGRGLLVFLAVHRDDGITDVDWMCGKITAMRIFGDDEGKMNRSVVDIAGEILLISQFTLFGNMRKGSRPSFNKSAIPEVAIPLYEAASKKLETLLNKPIPQGVFAAHMDIKAQNDGPVTIILDSKEKDL